VPEETKIMQEEPFVPIAPFENFYELIMRANSLPYGLAGYAFTCSLATATRVRGTGREGGRARYL